MQFNKTIFPFVQSEQANGNSQPKDMDHQPIQWPLSIDPLHIHDDGPVISMGGNQAGPAHSPPPVIEHAPLDQMPYVLLAVDHGPEFLVAASTGPSNDATTLDPLPTTLPAHEARAGAHISAPPEADGLSNKTT